MRIKRVVAVFVIWLVAVNVFGVIALNRLNLSGDTAYGWIDSKSFVQEQSWDPVALHARWDSVWYLDIAKDGYSFDGPGKLSNIVFFPLYPALIKAASPFTGGDLALSGWILSAVFLLFAMVFLAKLVREFHKGTDPEIALALMLVFPTAFFLNAVYSESLFLFLSIAIFYYLFKRNFLLAGAIAFLAAMTRATGLMLTIPIAWEWWQARGKIARPWRDAVAMLAAPLGTALFFLYHRLRFGDFLLFFKVEDAWGRSFALNHEHLELISHPAVLNLALDLGFVAFAAVMTYLVFRRLRVSYALYMAAAILLVLGTGTPMSIGRYILILFPMFILLAQWKDRRALVGYAFVSTLLFALYTTLFVNGYWAG